MNIKKLVGLILLLCITRAWAIEPFIIKDIRVEGIQRTDAGHGVQLPARQGRRHDGQ